MCQHWCKLFKTTFLSFSLCYNRYQSLIIWIHCSSGTRCTKGLWVHNWNIGESGLFLFWVYRSSRITIFHMSRQLSCHTCKIVTWSDIFSTKSNTQFYEILIGILLTLPEISPIQRPVILVDIIYVVFRNIPREMVLQRRSLSTFGLPYPDNKVHGTNMGPT